MKKAIFAFFTFLQFSLLAYAGENTMQGPYIGGLTGVNFMNGNHVKFHTGYRLGVCAGYKLTSCENPMLNLRVEGEFSYRHNAVRCVKYGSEKNHVHGYSDSYNYMANVYYDVETCTAWTPYVGVGIGCVHTKEHSKFKIAPGASVSSSISHNNFASQYIGGIAYEIVPGMQVGGEYRYLVVNKQPNEQVVALTLRQYF